MKVSEARRLVREATAFEGCFCNQPRNDGEGAYAVWVQCDLCSRWCHGECAGVASEAEASQLGRYVR
jgi:hypothetical protein